ncbi:MAG: hypothetical protein AAGE99_06095, partial [Chlamydiota bacterium]
VLRMRESVSAGFYHSIFLSRWFNQEVMRGISGAQLPRTKFSFISEIEIPNPSTSVQHTLYEEIIEEKSLVESNKRLIGIYMQKIQDRVSRVWGD